MSEEKQPPGASEETKFSRQVGAQAERKLKARRAAKRTIWFGLGVSGVIGWSVTVPTLLGAALGIWIDAHHPSKLSWTLMLLFLGLLSGCLNAWHWIEAQYEDMQEDPDD